MLDLLDAFADSADEVQFLKALDRLAPATTTIVLGTPVTPRQSPSLSRTVVGLDLDDLEPSALDRKDALA
jgi:hypothetical protein